MVCETHCGHYQCTVNGRLSVKSLCLGVHGDGSLIKMRGNQVTDKTIHWSKCRLLQGHGCVCCLFMWQHIYSTSNSKFTFYSFSWYYSQDKFCHYETHEAFTLLVLMLQCCKIELRRFCNFNPAFDPETFDIENICLERNSPSVTEAEN